MMDIFTGKHTDNFEEAIVLALRESGMSRISQDAITIFAPVIDTDKLKTQAERNINAAVREHYGRGATCYGKRWYVPLPQPGFDRQPIPRLIFTVQTYLVAAVKVNTRDYNHRATLVGSIDKPQKVILPLSFLQSVLDDEPEQFEIVGKDGNYTSWSIPGLKETIRLSDYFVAGLSDVLRLKSGVSWLLDFGTSGEAVFPQVAGSLLGIQSLGMTDDLPIWDQPFQAKVVIDTLTHMFGSARAAAMYQQREPYLKPTMTNKEAISFILREEGRRF